VVAPEEAEIRAASGKPVYKIEGWELVKTLHIAVRAEFWRVFRKKRSPFGLL
jgi:hypothetical protein